MVGGWLSVVGCRLYVDVCERGASYVLHVGDLNIVFGLPTHDFFIEQKTRATHTSIHQSREEKSVHG